MRTALKLGLVAGVLALTGALMIGPGTDTAVAAEDTQLQKDMEVINTGYKKLRREARKGEISKENLKMIVEMQVASLSSMHQPVPKIDKAGGDKAKMYIEYKKQMADLTKMLMDLEIAIESGDKEAAVKIVSESLGASKKKGHDDFTEDE